MKHLIISIIMLFAIALPSSPVKAEESYGVELSIGSACVKSGDTFTVPVYAEVNEGFASFIIDIEYDNTVLTPVDVKRTLLLGGSIVKNIHAEENEIRVVYAGMINHTESGILFNVEFKAISATDAVSELKPVIDFLSNEDLNNVTHTETKGYAAVAVNRWLPFYVQLNTLSDNTEVEVSNILDKKAAGTLYLASYDEEGRLVTAQSRKVSADSLESGLIYNFNIPEADCVKAFVLAEDMQPYSYLVEANKSLN